VSGETRERKDDGPLKDRESRFLRGLDDATGGGRMATLGLLALAALVGLAFLFDF
jgi:hypothetical protein